MSEGPHGSFHHSTYYPPYPPPQQYYGLQMTKEQDVRNGVILALLAKGYPSTRLERTADALVQYILEGKKEDPSIVKKTEVKFPGDRAVEAHAYLLDDNTIHIELKDPEMLATLFESLEVYGISFYGIPASPVDTSKDN